MQIIIGITVFFGGFITAWLVGKIRIRILEKRTKKRFDKTVCMGDLGLPRYKKDGSYTGAKTVLVTNYELKAERENSERSENQNECERGGGV